MRQRYRRQKLGRILLTTLGTTRLLGIRNWNSQTILFGSSSRDFLESAHWARDQAEFKCIKSEQKEQQTTEGVEEQLRYWTKNVIKYPQPHTLLDFLRGILFLFKYFRLEIIIRFTTVRCWRITIELGGITLSNCCLLIFFL